MKKTIGLVAAALFCVTSGFASVDNSQPVISEVKGEEALPSGKEAVAKIRTGYQEGVYDSFLKEADDTYEQVKSDGSLADLARFREVSSENDGWVESVKILQKDKNRQLLQAVAGHETPFADKVRSAAAPSFEEREVAEKVLSKFHQMAPGSGKNSDENALIDLSLEYEYKTLHLGMPSIEGQEVSDLREKYNVLKMEQMDKMLLASQAFEDAALKNSVEVFAQNPDAFLSKSWDLTDVHALAKRGTKPADRTEERVISILQSHQEKMGELTRSL